MQVLPPHDLVAEELAKVVDLPARVRQCVNEAPWRAAYRRHPVVTANPDEPVVPVALYVDGVQYQNRDSVQGYWLHNLLTDKHHCFVVFRQKHRCRCGCRGWCSQFTLLKFLHWTLRAMADGVYPAIRHDGEWLPEQGGAATAGEELGFKAAVIMARGDWSELRHAFGYPSWQTHAHSCLLCFAQKRP